jgi:outer membrane biosynthesis protein TonB
VNKELENSLFESIQTYLDGRLRSIDEQLAKLQSDFNEGLAHAREAAASSPVQDTPLSSAISAHLQTAREQKLTGAPAVAGVPADLSGLRRGIDELKDQQTQSDVLSTLLRNAVQFADRAVLFVIKGDQAIAWRMCEAQDPGNLQTPGVAVPLNGTTVVSQAVKSNSAETTSGTSSDDSVLINQLRGDAQQLAALPLTVRGKVVAVLYVDSAWPHRDAIQLDALDVLTQVAGMAVELAGPRATRPAPASTRPVEAVQPAEAAPATPAETTSAEPVQPEEPSYIPQVETQPAPQVEAQPPAAWAEEPSVSEAETAEVETPAVEAAPEPEIAPREESIAPPPIETPVETPVFTEQYSTPLGRSRRYGTPEADLPVQVNDEERRLHNDARRFARLLVSEIKLYNEQKVSEGRNQSDIYDRLRDDIDRSRQMYDKRVAPPVAARHDYFHQELVNTLAEGDPAKLGGSYPGAAVAV